MKQQLKYFYLASLVVFSTFLFSQNETNKWYFGLPAGLDFMTNPPAILSNGVLSTQEGCASVADAAGNLLFYTGGSTIRNSQHLVMANGFGLTGNTSSTQSALIIKKPGSNTIYYVFTAPVGAGNVNYSTVDMTLAAGLGSVTTLNTTLFSGSTERLTAARHCNGTDIWVITHDTTRNFKCFLVTASGVNSNAINTSIGTSHTGYGNWVGYMKPSPNGKKLAVCVGDSSGFELYDFDASTGVVSNSLVLAVANRAYGVEFSPDGTKLYGTQGFKFTPLYQWDLCAGSPSAIIASQYTIACDPNNYRYALQQASNGKIYVARYNQNTIGVIHNPNLSGAACNFVELGQSVAPGFCAIGLPNFMSSLFKPQPIPFIYATNNQLYGCQAASFTIPAVSNMNLVNCASAGYSVTNVLWNFGDPSSGSSNTSTLFNPTHAYTAIGTYTAQVILYYTCGGGSDTLIQPVTINQPCINVITNGINCSSPGSATATAVGGTGPYSYTWMPTAQTSSVATGLFPGTYSVTVKDLSTNISFSVSIPISPAIPFTGILASSASVACHGAHTGTAMINVSGGSSNRTYHWNSSSGSQTTVIAGNLGAGIHTLTVTDGLGYCSFIKSFTITQPPPFSLALTVSSSSACLGTGITFTAVASGGTPAYTYTWTAGPQVSTYSVNPALAGNYNYTVTSRDLNNCVATKTISVSFLANPVPGIVANYTALCAGGNLSLNGSGGTSYAWSGPGNFSSSSQNTGINAISLTATGTYSLVVSAGSCTAGITQSITVFPLPAPILSALPACEQHPLQLTTNPGGSISYTWAGPMGFSSTLQNPVIYPVQKTHAGTYSLTVTDVKGCKASGTLQINVFSNPVVVAGGATVCLGAPAMLTASGAAGYDWSGPFGFNSHGATAFISSAGNLTQQLYSVIGTAVNGCTASATVNLNTLPLPSPLIYVTPRACVNSTISLQGSGGEVYEWRGPNNFFSKSQNVILTASNLSFAGIFTLTVYNTAGCSGSKTAPLILDELPSGSLQSKKSNYCIPFCSDFSLKLNSVSPLVNSTWQIGSQVFNTPSFSYCFSSAGDYIVKAVLTNSLGCSNTNTFVITALPLPKADFGFSPEKPIENIDRVYFSNTSAGPDINKWSWFFADKSKYKASGENASFLFENPGIYPVALVVQNLSGCKDTVVKTITVMSDFNLFVPNSFTPNLDGTNDQFQAKGTGVMSLTLWIYNRWGEKIFETNDYTQGWDGTYKGEDCKSDVYIWKIQAKSATGQFKDLNGLVTLYR